MKGPAFFIGVAGSAWMFSLAAQTPKAFEAISIRPNVTGAESSDTNTSTGRIAWINVTTLSLVRRAFGVQDVQIIGTPRWVTTDRYDVSAVTGTAAQLTDLDRQPYVQSMLADRFQFQFHRDKRELRAYSLVVAKGGPKMATYSGKGEYGMKVEPTPGTTILRSTKGNMNRLAEILGRITGRAVFNKTGLDGDYDFKLEWVPEQATETAGASLFSALQEQIGLKLEPAKEPVDVIVIDRIEKPSAN